MSSSHLVLCSVYVYVHVHVYMMAPFVKVGLDAVMGDGVSARAFLFPRNFPTLSMEIL